MIWLLFESNSSCGMHFNLTTCVPCRHELVFAEWWRKASRCVPKDSRKHCNGCIRTARLMYELFVEGYTTTTHK
jgi:hypothetical protein